MSISAFTFHSRRGHDPLLAAIATLKMGYAEGRRVMPDRIPPAHLGKAERRLICESEKPDRRLFEIATLAHLRRQSAD
jgi:hypothetical protein